MTSEPIDCGYLSLSPDIQAACEAGPPESDRTRIEIIADDLHLPVKVDFEADMAYLRVRRPRHFVDRTDLQREPDGVLADYDEKNRLLGIEVFLRHGTVRPETVAAIEAVLDAEWDRERDSRGPLVKAWKWVESYWTYYRHMWGPLCWTCAECREQNRWLKSEGYAPIGGRWWSTKQRVL